MSAQCTPAQMEFQGLGTRKVQGAFDGGYISSDGGAVLLRELDARLRLTERLAACFTDHRRPAWVEHSVLTLVRQRVYGIALGYEDLNDHDELSRDPLVALAAGQPDAEGRTRRRVRDRGRALAAHSTLNRLERTPETLVRENRYWKITHDAARLEQAMVEVSLDTFEAPPSEMILDLDATDDPIHGEQEGRFFHGYYRNYCFLPLYVFCGGRLLMAKLRTSDRDASDGSVEAVAMLADRIRRRWPQTRILVRGDSGFARDALMAWCEAHGVFYVLGLAKNTRLLQKIGPEMVEARDRQAATGEAARVFTQFPWRTKKSWTRSRRVVAKAEHLAQGANPRFIVTNLDEAYAAAQPLYEATYCARGEMENRIKEQQLDLFADRTSSHTLRSNQLRVWFAAFAYILVDAVRRIGLEGTSLAKATCGTIRLKLFKIGTRLQVTVRRVVLHFATACPYQEVFRQALHQLRTRPLRC